MTAPTLDRATAAEHARQLVARHQAGDPDAYADIYRRYRREIYHFIYRKVGDRQLAEDLTGDTFVRGLGSIGRWRWQGKDVGAWLTTIARNLVVDHFKSAPRRYEVKTADPQNGDRTDDSPEGRPETAVIDHLRNLALLGALRHLTGDQRTCIIHRFVHSRSVAETAALMGRQEGAVKVLTMRAVAALGHHFDERPWQ
jgi:RNA polymerase sigma-70 factor (ECF subfamily)